jgi:DNA-binding CsgD family transcriptional regulator
MTGSMEQRKSKMPEANKMARMLRSGRTLGDLAVRYGINSNAISQQLYLHGWDARTGQKKECGVNMDYGHHPPALSARGDGPGHTCHHVGGGDNPTVVPTVAVPYRERPHYAGIVWPVVETAWKVPPKTKPRPRPAPRARKINTEQETEMSARYLNGESSVALAAAYGVNERTIRSRLRKLGVPMRSRGEALRLRHAQLRATVTVELPAQDVA